jgi:hypothetical protein
MQKYTWQGALSGAMLGDGHLTGNRLVSTHTNRQRAYVLWKAAWLEGLGLKVDTRLDYIKTTNLGKYMYSSVKVTLPTKDLHHLPAEDLVHRLDELGLLIWWLDDGSMTVNLKKTGSVGRFGYLNTQAHSLETNERISAAILSRFGICTNVHKDAGSGFRGKDALYYRLYINATNMRKLIDIVYDIIPKLPKEMLYKLDMGYIPNRLKASKEQAARYNVCELFGTLK